MTLMSRYCMTRERHIEASSGVGVKALGTGQLSIYHDSQAATLYLKNTPPSFRLDPSPVPCSLSFKTPYGARLCSFLYSIPQACLRLKMEPSTKLATCVDRLPRFQILVTGGALLRSMTRSKRQSGFDFAAANSFCPSLDACIRSTALSRYLCQVALTLQDCTTAALATTMRTEVKTKRRKLKSIYNQL